MSQLDETSWQYSFNVVFFIFIFIFFKKSTLLFPLCKSVKLAISKCTEKIKSISENYKSTIEELDEKVSIFLKKYFCLQYTRKCLLYHCHVLPTLHLVKYEQLLRLFANAVVVYLWIRKYAQIVRADACGIPRTLTQDISYVSAWGRR